MRRPPSYSGYRCSCSGKCTFNTLVSIEKSSPPPLVHQAILKVILTKSLQAWCGGAVGGNF